MSSGQLLVTTVPSGPSSGRGRGLPIAVASGLAVGVFLGLLLVRGKSPTTSVAGDDVAAVADDNGVGNGTGALASDAAQPSAVSADPAAPTPVADAGAEVAAVEAVPKIAVARVTFEILPKDVTEREGFSLTIDDKPVLGNNSVVTIENGVREITVVVNVPGYHRAVRRRDITGDETVTIRLKKRGSSNTSSGPGSAVTL